MSISQRIIRTICPYIFIITVPACAELIGDSYEINRVDLSPFNDAILFNDIAEIINDFDSNMYAPTPTTSESDENIEDLLSEYQHYLEKAHKQRKNYEEKSKSKNKIPLLRREKYTKIKPFPENKYADYMDTFPNTYKFPERPVNNQLDFFIPYHSDFKYYRSPDFSTMPRKNTEIVKTVSDDKKLMNYNPFVPTINYDLPKPSCVCKDNQIPCNCNCKQCIIPFDSYDNVDKKIKKTNAYENKLAHPGIPLLGDDLYDASNNQLNIRIKVDIQLPKIFDPVLRKRNSTQENVMENDGKNSNEARLLNFSPMSKLNFPMPIEFLGVRKPMRLNKHDSGDVHKITIHKKKKTKLNNSASKKHKKRIITFHNIKFEPQVLPMFKVDDNFNDGINNHSIENNDFKFQAQYNDSQNTNATSFSVNASTTIIPIGNVGETNGNNSEYPAHISIENKTDDNHKTENSIEVDFVKTVLNATTELPVKVRNKRSAENHETRKQANNNNESDPIKNMKDNNKQLNADSELLYWPNNDKNCSRTLSKNITEIILERENNKVKLDMSQETIRKNHTLALEHAIFGNVDWNDVDTVAPVFMSFMGKYIRGILTFCSQTICHSMKCMDKICAHRVCAPEERFNQRGHCAGSNQTDSVATMEALMDLPSNIAFEIVDILQNKMLGKIYGKNLPLYVNPWKTGSKEPPVKIINFNADGYVYEEQVLPAMIANQKTLIDKFKQTVGEWKKKYKNRRRHFARYKQVPPWPKTPTKLKMLVHCVEMKSICRFLTCPVIKEFCILCETNITDENNNSTTCTVERTDFLILRK